jgi:hypothetical protein
VIRVGMERKRVVDDRGRSHGVLPQTGAGSGGITCNGKAKAMRREKSDGAVVVWMPRPMNPGDRREGKTGRSEGHLAVSSQKPQPSGTG